MSAPEPPIFVVVSSDDLTERFRARHPGRRPNPIVFETNVEGATLERAQVMAARLESQGYGACRVGRVAFDEKPPAAATASADAARYRWLRDQANASHEVWNLLNRIDCVGELYDEAVDAAMRGDPLPSMPDAVQQREASPELPF